MDSARPKYRIMISSVDAFGHMSCTLGLGEILSKAGHEVTFVHRAKYKKLADRRNFKFIPLDESIFENQPAVDFVEWTEHNKKRFHGDPIQRYSNWTDEDKESFSQMVSGFGTVNQAMEKVIEENRNLFDLLIGDFVTQYPALTKSPIPYIPLLSMNPMPLYSQAPPGFSGYPIGCSQDQADDFKRLFQSATSVMIDKLNVWWQKHNIPILSGRTWIYDVPKYFGFYHYPEALDYNECEPMDKDHKGKWFRLDAVIRKPDLETPFIIPESIASLPGKLIYFSLGSLGSSDVELMKKIISILSKSPNRFIVSKGPRGDLIELAGNMWGENYVNQMAIIPMVDMVITHGGNNTFLETIYFGKPLIVIPYFFDQFDNAQRVVDCRIGRRIDTWDLEEKKILDTIEDTLNDQEARKKISDIAVSMRSTSSHAKAVDMIEKLISDLKKEH